MLDAGKRKLSKPIQKKEPLTLRMLEDLCVRYAGADANLSDLRVAALCVTGFYGFLRYNEISSLRCCDLQFRQCDGAKFVELYILKSKTDVYRDGSKVILSHNGGASCPYGILKRYVDTAKLQLSSSDPLFSRLQYLTSTKSYKVRAGNAVLYTNTRNCPSGPRFHGL